MWFNYHYPESGEAAPTRFMYRTLNGYKSGHDSQKKCNCFPSKEWASHLYENPSQQKKARGLCVPDRAFLTTPRRWVIGRLAHDTCQIK